MKSTLLFFFFALCSIVSAKTYYVAPPKANPAGNDNNAGTITAPWASWQKAFQSTSVQAGDTVYFRGGVYQTTVINGTGIRANRSGTAEKWIVYINYPNEKPIIDFGNIVADDISYPSSLNYGLVTMDISYVKIKGLNIRNVKQYFDRNFGVGIVLRDGYVILENCTAYNCWGTGIGSSHNSNNDGDHGIHYLINCDAYNNCDSISGNPAGSNAGNVGNGISVSNNYSSLGETYLINCRAWGNSDQGFNLSPNNYVKAEGCWSFANTGYGNGGGGGYKLGWQDWEAYFIRREIYNCVAAYNTEYGFFTNETGTTAPWYAVRSRQYNNTAYRNGYEKASMGFIIRDTNQADSIEQKRVFSNNISYDNYIDLYDAGGAAKCSGSKNSWQAATGVTITDADFVSLDTTGITAARQADGSLPDNDCFNKFLRLTAVSDLRDAGVDVGLPFNGSAPDLGYSEYSTGAVTISTPTYITSKIENASPSRLEITYNLTLANTVTASSSFTVRVNSVARTVSSVLISGTKVLLTLASPVVYGDAVTVAYTKPVTNPLQTASGGQAASITAQNVANNVVAVNPVYVSSVIENASPSRLEMIYNLTLANIVTAATSFTVRVNSVARTVSSVLISGTKVLLTLASPVVYGDAVTIAYTKPATNPLQTASGGQASSITAQNVTNNVVGVNPVYVSSIIENATPSTLIMTYNMTLANIVPAASAFTVRVNSVARTVSSVLISGIKVQLTLASPVVYGDIVTVAYTKPATNPLQTASGGQASSITGQSVINNCTAPTNQPPIVNLSSPTKSTSFAAPATITIDAVASDPDGTVIKVEFYQGTVKLGEKTSAPYSYTWKEVPEGTYSITAAATDNQNLKTFSNAVSVVVGKSATAINQLPIVSITSPIIGKKNKKNDNIIIEAVASDPDGSITKVEFKSGNITLAEVTTVPYVYIWGAVDTGTFVIAVVATDNLGATSATNYLTLFVDPVYDINSEIINLYPNPNDGHFTIDFDSAFPKTNNAITVVSLTGKTVYSNTITEQEHSREINLPDISAGTYILMVTSGNSICTTKKFIKH